jgi:hypothetical protein
MLLFSNGALMNKSFSKIKSSFGGAKVAPIPNSPLDRWFVGEELSRPTNKGHVFFIHSKVLLIDPLSNDPLVCSGSANFSTNSLIANDENMLLIRGDTRVADIYVTELDRIFRHFYARDVINGLAGKGNQDDPLLLDPTDGWVAQNYKPGSYKNNRREMFFSPPSVANGGWAKAAAKDSDPFKDEAARAAARRAGKTAARRKQASPAKKKAAARPRAKGKKRKVVN